MKVHLDPDIFEIVKNGSKTVEVRLNDEKRRMLKIGDELIFINKNNENEIIESIVTDLKYYNNFEQLMEDYMVEEVYKTGVTKEWFLNLLQRFYNEEQQEKYGVVAIRFKKQ